MRKKLVSAMLGLSMAAGLLTGYGGQQVLAAESAGKITLFCDDAATQENFQEYVDAAEEATGLEIEVIAMPTNTDDRTAKVMTVLSSGDDSVDVISIDQEMLLSLGGTDYLEPLDDVLTDEVKAAYPESFIEMSKGKGVPMFMEIFCFWLNGKYVKEAGMDSVKTKDEFVKYLETVSKDGVYGYGGGWEQTYVWNDVGEFVNLFDGDLFDWSNENTQAAVKFMKEMVDKKYTPISQLADQYTELNQRIMDGTSASMLNYSSFMPTYDAAGRYGEEDIYIAPMLNLGKEETYANGWQYVLNAASQNKDEAKIFLNWAASLEGQEAYGRIFSRLPARTDVVDDPDFTVPGLEQLKSYLTDTTLVPRPLPVNSMEYINEVGSLFQKYVSDELGFEDYIEKMQNCMNTYFPEETGNGGQD
ncbi:MAG: extracellular solute-binding protein [Eubacteriales bacterium]|nr:extracellular solute-binding protein [Eubacteriales bacterium]